MPEDEQKLEKDSEAPAWKERFSKFLWTFFTFAAIILFYHLVQYLGKISAFFLTVLKGISPVIWGLILAYLLEPIANFWEKTLLDWKLPKSKDPEKTKKTMHVLSAVMMVISAIIIIALLLLLIIPEISNSITGIITALPSQMENISYNLRIRKYFDNSTTFGEYANSALLKIFQYLENWLADADGLSSQIDKIVNYFYAGIKSVFSVIYNLLVGLILSLYITIDKAKLQRQVKKITYSIFSRETAGRMQRSLKRGNKKFSAAIRGKLIDSMIIGLICFFLLTILNFLPFFSFPYPILLAVIVGVTNVVPFFGPIVGGIITEILVLFDNPKMAIPYIIMIVILQQFDANYLDPRMVGGSIGLRPFWSISAVLLGSSILGVPGFILGPPIVAFLYEIISEWTDDKIRAKGMAEDFQISPFPETDIDGNPPPHEPFGKHFKSMIQNAGTKISEIAQKISQKK